MWIEITFKEFFELRKSTGWLPISNTGLMKHGYWEEFGGRLRVEERPLLKIRDMHTQSKYFKREELK